MSDLVSNSLIDEIETYQNDNCIKFETLRIFGVNFDTSMMLYLL